MKYNKDIIVRKQGTSIELTAMTNEHAAGQQDAEGVDYIFKIAWPAFSYIFSRLGLDSFNVFRHNMIHHPTVFLS